MEIRLIISQEVGYWVIAFLQVGVSRKAWLSWIFSYLSFSLMNSYILDFLLHKTPKNLNKSLTVLKSSQLPALPAYLQSGGVWPSLHLLLSSSIILVVYK